MNIVEEMLDLIQRYTERASVLKQAETPKVSVVVATVARLRARRRLEKAAAFVETDGVSAEAGGPSNFPDAVRVHTSHDEPWSHSKVNCSGSATSGVLRLRPHRTGKVRRGGGYFPRPPARPQVMLLLR